MASPQFSPEALFPSLDELTLCVWVWLKKTKKQNVYRHHIWHTLTWRILKECLTRFWKTSRCWPALMLFVGQGNNLPLNVTLFRFSTDQRGPREDWGSRWKGAACSHHLEPHPGPPVTPVSIISTPTEQYDWSHTGSPLCWSHLLPLAPLPFRSLSV